MQWTEL